MDHRGRPLRRSHRPPSDTAGAATHKEDVSPEEPEGVSRPPVRLASRQRAPRSSDRVRNVDKLGPTEEEAHYHHGAPFKTFHFFKVHSPHCGQRPLA